MQSPFFSVILPTYNRANMIGKAIESVLAQTYTNWELIVVDDGSTDNTKQVVEAYNDTRIRYIYQQNAERSAARNNGIDNANGVYVCFIDSDDYFLPNHLTEFYKEIEKDADAGMFFGQTVADNNGVLTNVIVENKPNNYNTNQEYLIVNPVRVAAACVKKSILVNNKFDTQIRIGEDTELWVRIANRNSIKMIDAYTQVYVAHDEQTVSEKSQKPMLQHIETLKYIFLNHNAGNTISKKIKRYSLAYAYFRLAQINFMLGKYWKGVQNILISSTYMPFFRSKEKLYLIITSPKF